MNKLFLIVGRTEGVSYLFLLIIAMPLKYLWGQPQWVRATGMIHGVLFIAYIWLVTQLAYQRSWPWRKTALGYLASLLPFGTFLFERQLERK